MRPHAVFSLLLLMAGTGFAQQPTREEQQRHLQAIERYRSGQDAMARERIEQAVEEFKVAVQLDPLLTLAHFRLGQAHMALREFVQAEKAFLACRRAYEEVSNLRFTNREALERRRDEEVDELENYLIQLQSGMIKGSNQTVVLRVQQQIEELKRKRRRNGAEGFTTPAELSVSLGSAYFRQSKLEEAEREWKAATEVNPNLGEAHNNLAVLYLMTSRPGDAQGELKLAEKSGYPVHPGLKDDIKKALKAPAPN